VLFEFSSIVCSFYIVSDVNRIESVQRSFTQSINYLRFSTYKERLIKLGLENLQCSLIYCKDHSTNMWSNDFSVLSHETNLRGNQCKLVKLKIASDHDANFFCNRVVNI
jgi:hypothetical protein